MDYTNWKTLKGLTLPQLAEKLDEALPPEAYKAIPGAAHLTDIDPAYMKKVLNECFGLCGIGWGYDFSPEDLAIRIHSGGNKNGWTAVTIRNGTFWYTLRNGEQEERFSIPVSGGSENSRGEFALKGAVTNLIGHGASQIGFQASVYMGKRSHRTVSEKQSQTDSRAITAFPAGQVFHVPTGTGIAEKHVSKPLAELSEQALRYYGKGNFMPLDNAGNLLQKKCLQELQLRAAAV